MQDAATFIELYPVGSPTMDDQINTSPIPTLGVLEKLYICDLLLLQIISVKVLLL